MANEIKTRIQLKYDSYANWTAEANQFVVKKGEVCIAEVAPFTNEQNPSNATTGQHPVLFKVGNGSLTFNQLPWASALAADVHTWAKQSLDEFTAWVAKTPKTVTLQVNGENTDYTIEEAIKLVRNEITAGGEAAAITIADESTDGKIKYTAKQGGTAIVESIEINEGAGIEISVEDNVPKISHQAKPTTGTTQNADAGTGRTYVTEVLVDDFGHIAGVKTASETDQEVDWETEVPAHETPVTITDDKPTATLDSGLIYAVTNLVEDGTNGHAITATYGAVATKSYVDTKVTGAVDYKGTVAALGDLDITAGRGDFCRVAVEIKSGDTVLAHPGDLLIAEKDNPAAQIDGVNWSVIHGEEGDITEIIANEGLEGGGSVNSITIGIADGGVGTDKIADKAVTANKLADDAKKLISDVDDKVAKINASLSRGTADDIEFTFTDADNTTTLTIVEAGAELNLDTSSEGTTEQIVINHDKHEFIAPTTGDYVSGITVNEYGHVTGYTKAVLPTINPYQLDAKTDGPGVAIELTDGTNNDSILVVGDEDITVAYNTNGDQAVEVQLTKVAASKIYDDQYNKETNNVATLIFNCGSATEVL